MTDTISAEGLSMTPRDKSDYTTLYDLDTLRASIEENIADYNHPEGVAWDKELRAGIEGQLEEYGGDIMCARSVVGSLVVIEYPPELLTHSASYDAVRETFPGEEPHTLHIPGSAIQAARFRINTLGTPAGSRNIEDSPIDPVVDLKIKTGREPVVSTIRDGVLTEDDTIGRWVRFPFAATGFQVLAPLG